MITVTLDELQVNQVTAALDARVAKLGRDLANLKEQRDSTDNRFEIECVEAALRDALKAHLVIAESFPDAEYPADMSIARLEWAEVTLGPASAWTEGELRGAWGDR